MTKDLIDRADALAAIALGDTVNQLQSKIRAIPATDARAEAQLCGPADAVTLKPTTTPELVGFLTDAAGIAMKARAEALREAAAVAFTASTSKAPATERKKIAAAIRALIPETKP